MQLPEVIEFNATDNGGHLSLKISPDLKAFEGHFEKVAIVPGVVQIQWAIAFANHYLSKISAVDITSMDKLKFQNVIQPNCVVDLFLERLDNKLLFSFTSKELKHSSGKIVIG